MKAINPKDLDRKTRPTDDFFAFISGGWAKRNPIPVTETRWGTFYEIIDRNRKSLKKILESAMRIKSLRGSITQKVGDFYFSAMDTKSVNRAGLQPLAGVLQRIDEIKTIEALIEVITFLHQLEVAAFWFPHVEQDDKNSEKYILRFYQHGLGLPDRDYYTRTDSRSLALKKKYLKHIATILKLSGYRPRDAIRVADKILALETRLAHASMTNVERRDVHKMYNEMSLVKLRKLTPNMPWDIYFRNLGVKNISDVIVSQPNFLKEVDLVLHSVHLDDIKTYLKFHVVNGYAGYLSEPFEKEVFWFYGTVMNGVKKMKPRWKRALSMVDESLGEALGQLYVDKYFPPQSKQRMMELIENIRNAYRERIKNLNWMTEGTKRKALTKLSSIVYKIGYPDKWRDYSKLDVTRDSLAQNVMNAALFESQREISKLGKPVDRKEWHMSPPTVNAYYSQNMNEIVFPAGILQPPFFSETADDAVNYGAIGSVIGHELTHGFDDQGCHFDGKGNMRNWWTTEDRKHFEKKAEVLIQQYNEFVAIDDLHVNGKLTLGENIADLGGLVIAYDAFRLASKSKKEKVIDGLTPVQRFFIGFAIGERGIYRPEALRERVLTDPHSPPKARVNIPVSNLSEFYEAFDCKPGDALYRAEEERAKIW